MTVTMGALILACLYGVWRAAASSWSGILPRQALQQRGYRVLEIIGSQLRCCYVPRDGESHDLEGRQVEERALKGRRSTSETFLELITTRSAGFGEVPDYGLVKAAYRFDRPGARLLYRETDWPNLIEENRRDWQVLCEDVSEIRLTYYQQAQEYPEWNPGERAGLPEIVRLELSLQTLRVQWQESLLVRPVVNEALL